MTDNKEVKEFTEKTGLSEKAINQIPIFNTLKEGECEQFVSSGQCHGDCCGCVTFNERHFMQLKKFIPRDKEYFATKTKENGVAMVKPVTPNYKCVFLGKDSKCIIYNSHLRPQFCKDFGCNSKEPFYACPHINKEYKNELEEFAKIYLQAQSKAGNPLAMHILAQLQKANEDNKEQEK